MPAVSIVTTTLNRTGYLRQAIQSALSQSFTDFELLVCDDGGLEETRRLCRGFCDPRILHTVNPSPLGIALNTFAGIQRARAGLIAFLNDDDRWTPGFLAACATPLLADADAVLAFCDHWLIDADGNRLHQASDANTRDYGRAALPSGSVPRPAELMARLSVPLAMAAVFRKSSVDWRLYSEKVQGAYDSFIAYSLLRAGGAVLYIPQRLTEYRVHSAGASAQFHRATTEGLAYVHSLMLRDPAFRAIAQPIRKKYLGMEKHLVKLSLLHADIPAALAHAARMARAAVLWRNS